MIQVNKLKRTNENIKSELTKKGLIISDKSAYKYFISGEYDDKKIQIGCASLKALIHEGSLLPYYLGVNKIF